MQEFGKRFQHKPVVSTNGPTDRRVFVDFPNEVKPTSFGKMRLDLHYVIPLLH